MRFNLEQWVAKVQAQPEPIRMRYLFGCVAFSMLLVVGVWSLSVSEGLQSISQETKSAAKEVQGLLPKTDGFSLDNLLSGDKSLEERKREVSGELFFQEALESRETPNFEEGFSPKATGEDSTTTAPTR